MSSVRARIVRNALWGVRNAASISYSQERPIDGILLPYKLPLAVDCSGFVTLCYCWTNPQAPDPNGWRCSGVGFTRTISEACRELPVRDALHGDIVAFGPHGGQHVALVIRPGRDPLLATHGDGAGPKLARASSVARDHYPPVRALRVPGMDAAATGATATNKTT